MKNGYKIYQCRFDDSGCFIPMLETRIDFDYVYEVYNWVKNLGDLFCIDNDSELFACFLAPAGKNVESYIVRNGIQTTYWLVVHDE